MRRSFQAEVYFTRLLNGHNGGQCDHPAELRLPPFSDGRPATLDPQEWECGVCGTLQLRKPEPAR